MAFIQVSGPVKMEQYVRPASTAFSAGQAVILTSGVLADATTSSTRHVGIMQKAVTASDADYATDTPVSVLALDPESVFEADIGSGTWAATYVGAQCDLATATTIALATNTHHQLTIVGAGSSSTKALVKFNSSYIFSNAS